MNERLPRSAASVVVGLATAVVLVALAVLPFLNPVWIGFAQDSAGSWTTGGRAGWTEAERDAATSAILADLLVGQGDFDVRVRGEPVLSAAERSHMVDVRGVLRGFGLIAIVAVVLLVIVQRRATDRAAFWRAVRAGGVGVGAAVAAVAVASLVAFDAVFELFHRVLFPGGNYTFDPSTDRLVQLFPYRFWVITSFALGAVIVTLSAATALAANGRLRGSAPRRVVRPVAVEVGR